MTSMRVEFATRRDHARHRRRRCSGSRASPARRWSSARRSRRAARRAAAPAARDSALISPDQSSHARPMRVCHRRDRLGDVVGRRVERTPERVVGEVDLRALAPKHAGEQRRDVSRQAVRRSSGPGPSAATAASMVAAVVDAAIAGAIVHRAADHGSHIEQLGKERCSSARLRNATPLDPPVPRL